MKHFEGFVCPLMELVEVSDALCNEDFHMVGIAYSISSTRWKKKLVVW